jgi:hypothetical protein
MPNIKPYLTDRQWRLLEELADITEGNRERNIVVLAWNLHRLNNFGATLQGARIATENRGLVMPLTEE